MSAEPPKDQILWYTTGQAAQILGVNVSTIQDWIARDYLEGWRLPSGHRRVSRESVDKILAGRHRGE
jgi:excisionase family DNA binding protein